MAHAAPKRVVPGLALLASHYSAMFPPNSKIPPPRGPDVYLCGRYDSHRHVHGAVRHAPGRSAPNLHSACAALGVKLVEQAA